MTITPPSTDTPSGANPSLGSIAVATAIAGAAVLLNTDTASAITPALKFSDIPGTGDTKVLNYALALEQLEADLYSQALKRLTNGGTNALGITIPGLKLAATEPDVDYIAEFGKVEVQHRDFLTAALGSAGIKPFKYNFGIQNLSRQSVVSLVYTAEKTGVGAYLGAIKFLATRKYLQIAGAIQGTEARHTAVIAEISNLLFNVSLPVAPGPNDNGGRDTPLAPDTVLNAVSAYIVAA